jgi:hypothetical protein
MVSKEARMPDRDVYDRNVARGWQTAARRVYQGDDDELTLRSLLYSLGRVLKDGGCPGIDEIAAIVAQAVASPDPLVTRREAHAQMERVRRASGSTRTEVAGEVARRVLVDPGAVFPTLADGHDQERAKLGVAASILAELAIKKISPAAVTHELVEVERVPIEAVLARRRNAQGLLAGAPQLTKLAREVLAQPDGRLVKAPRVKTPKPSQEALVHIAISA